VDEIATALTRAQLEEIRGDLNAGNGAADLAVPLPNGKHAEPAQLCALEGCDLPVADGRGALYCSEAHRRRAAHLRNGQAALVITKSGSIEQSSGSVHTKPFSVYGLGPFEQLAAVAGMLPQGWRLEATADTVTLAWTR
jgi:hypothetical protein